MGAWGEGIFDNDEALDWLARATDDPTAVDTAFDAVCGAEYVDVDDGSAAVAAAALVAAALDGDISELDDDARAVVSKLSVDDRLRGRAVEALDRVVADDSELAELWEEESDGGFTRAISTLRMRLTRATPK